MPQKPELVSERPEIPKMHPEDRDHYRDCVVMLAAIFEGGPMHLKITASAMLRALWKLIYQHDYPRR